VLEPQNSNVTLRALTFDEALAVLEGRRPSAGWAPDYPADGDVACARFATFSSESEHEPWYAPWQIVEGDLVIGTIGFKGAPIAGELEVGYSIVPSAGGRGIATEALRQLLCLVHGRHLAVVGETAAWNLPSQSVLRHAGFIEVGERCDPDDGDLVIWRRATDPDEQVADAAR
jgi:RimJ/RimL family protein N-acetyltransferase